MTKNNLFIDFEFEFDLISLVSATKDYHLCWQLNRLLLFDFIRQEDIEIQNSKKRQLAYFNLFLFDDEINFLKYYLIGNKSSGSVLIPELKEVDFFLMISGSNTIEWTNLIHDKLKSLDSIQTLFLTNPAQLKSKQNLIFE